jgi:phosphate transport system protein
MVERPSNIGRCLNLMVISKSIERIADHVVDISSKVSYLTTADWSDNDLDD